MSDEPRSPSPLAIVIATLVVLSGLWLTWEAIAPPATPPAVAAPVATLQPTPPIVVPAGSQVRAVEPQISNAGDGDVTITYNITSVDMDICVALICPPAQP